ncbi:unnamed protein product [Paramecium sonneborni]|uniref:Uncharacterized protein n=1 Tax=Paramecium sonneborni TaxID=65129 RepID=A0A8S1QZG2_9CILI|nr:unnamed protein product [Paramecium sonneborni]
MKSNLQNISMLKCYSILLLLYCLKYEIGFIILKQRVIEIYLIMSKAQVKIAILNLQNEELPFNLLFIYVQYGLFEGEQ